MSDGLQRWDLTDLDRHGFTVQSIGSDVPWKDLLTLCATQLGCDPFGFDGTPNCFAVNSVRMGEGTFRSSTASSLGLHQEGYDLPVRPRYVVFYCVSPGAGGETLITDARRALSSLPIEARGQIERSSIRFRRAEALASWSDWRPAVEHDMAGRSILRFAEREVGFRDVEFKNLPGKVVDQMEAALNDKNVVHGWRSGDLLIIDNFRCLHGRRQADARCERHLIRLALGT